MAFKPLGGSSRRYVDTVTGETISRRQFDKLNKPVSVSPDSFGKPVRHMGRYNKLVSDFIVQHKKDTGVLLTRRQARGSNELKDIVKALKSKDNSKDGRKAIALFLLGRRNPDADYPVGGSPPVV